MTLRRATERPREVGSLPVLLIALLIAMSGDLFAQDRSRSRSNDSSYSGRTASPRADSSPSRSPSPSSPPRTANPSSPPSSSSGPSASSSPSRRHAVPGSPGEPHRQPPSRDRRDPDRGDGGGRWYGHGGYYYPSWYSYYGPGWWWAPYGYWGWWWGSWPYGPYSGYGYPYYGGYGGYGGSGYYGRGDGAGALDLDISPGRTQVYLDGQYIGTVDQYDGFPTYLWLEKGTYDIAFYLDGYTTLARQVSVYPGAVIDMEDRLQPGVSVRPEDLVSKSHERRDARESFERERQERIDRGEDPYVEEKEEDWRDRFSRDWEDLRGKGEETEIEDDGENGRTEQGRVRVEVEPDDASIYLDGQFVGTARDLANLRNGLLVEPGKHSVAVVRPGRWSVEREFEVESGEELKLEIELEPVTR